MQDEDYFNKTCSLVISTRTKLIADLEQLNFEVLPSGANFIFAKHQTKDGAELTAELRTRNIIVRHFKAPTRISTYLRITIGTDVQSDFLIRALTEILC